MSHALVIGGSGMLREASIDLAQRFDAVSVVGRSKSRLESLKNSCARIHPLAVDYTDQEKLCAEIDRAVREHGPVSLAVFWVHDTAPEVPVEVSRILSRSAKGVVDIYHVLGSAAASPENDATELLALFRGISKIAYHQIILGFVVEDGSARWLTNREISAGVTRALLQQDPRSIVGSVRPWQLRP